MHAATGGRPPAFALPPLALALGSVALVLSAAASFTRQAGLAIASYFDLKNPSGLRSGPIRRRGSLGSLDC
jgi:hypothetical protein